MQTFLPHASFARSAWSLDNRRLGKQRVEAWQVLRAITDPDYGWQHHPAVNMWRGHEDALALYGETITYTWILRGFKDSLLDNFTSRRVDDEPTLPSWIGDPEFHRSHQSNLIRKMPDHYGPQFPDVPDDLPYVWPVAA